MCACVTVCVCVCRWVGRVPSFLPNTENLCLIPECKALSHIGLMPAPQIRSPSLQCECGGSRDAERA